MSAIKDKIEESLSRSVCGGWDRGFLESILEQISKGRELSVKQKQTLGKVLARNSIEAQQVHDNWENVYQKQYRHDAEILAWYHSHQPYYKPMASDILNGRTPQRTKFLKMYENKYSKKVLAQAHAESKYQVGDYLVPRATFNSYKNAEFPADMIWAQQNIVIQAFREKGGFVVEVCSGIKSAAKGAKRYRLLPIGSTTPVIVEERFLKKGKTT
tara:strand:+ start:94 stop:735 length:642 start_codon:yes stop_codon:yes gene_type:complete